MIDQRSNPIPDSDTAGLHALKPELISVRTLSQLIDVSEKTIWDWIYRNRKHPSPDPLPYHKLGGLVRFKLKDVMAWVDRRKIRISSHAA